MSTRSPLWRQGPFWFRFGAISNWIVTAGAVLAPDRVAPWIGIDDIEYTFLLRIWAGMAFLWGCMFWEIARDMDGRRHMIKYAWIEKSVTAVSVTIAFAEGQVGWLCFGLILYTDYFWIPIFLIFDLITRGNPRPETALAEARATLNV